VRIQSIIVTVHSRTRELQCAFTMRLYVSGHRLIEAVTKFRPATLAANPMEQNI